jgi:hypothetical protein
MMMGIIYLLFIYFHDYSAAQRPITITKWDNQNKYIQKKGKQGSLYNVANNNSISAIGQTMKQREKTYMYIYMHSSSIQLIS